MRGAWCRVRPGPARAAMQLKRSRNSSPGPRAWQWPSDMEASDQIMRALCPGPYAPAPVSRPQFSGHYFVIYDYDDLFQHIPNSVMPVNLGPHAG